LDGNYNTTGSVVFAEFDRIRIEITDLGNSSYDRFFEIINIIPTQSKGEGTIITLECLGTEYHTQQIHMVKPYFFENHFTTAKDIGAIYNANRGSRQPALTDHDTVWDDVKGNDFPNYTANNYEFGLNEDSCYNRWIDLIDGVGAPVSAGGALTFFELSFDTSGINVIRMRLRTSGDNSTVKTIQNAKVTNPKTVGTQEGELSNPTGTNVLAWGSSEHGTLPVDNSRYNSKLMQFVFRPKWITGTVYAVDAIVKDILTEPPTNKHYKCLIAHTAGSTLLVDEGVGRWVAVDMSEEFGDAIQYSPFTDDRQTTWSNHGADPDRTTYTTAAWFDINVVVNEEEFFRTWVDVRATTNTALDLVAVDKANDGTNIGYAYDGGSINNLPRGFRILVDGNSPTGVLADFANMVVEVRGTDSVGGKEFGRLYNFVPANDQVQVAVLHEGKVYVDTIGGTPSSPTHSWASKSTTAFANDCFHPYTTVPTNVAGIDLVGDPTGADFRPRSAVTDSTNRPDITRDGSPFGTNVNSAIQFKSVSAPAQLKTDQDKTTEAESETGAWYDNVIGFNWRIPYPYSNFNSIGTGVGDLYGGGINGNEEPATLDIQNMNFTSGGRQGFNHGDPSEDYGQINAVAFWLNYSVVSTIGSIELNDEHQFRAWFIDTRDNVVYQDFVIRFSNHWEDIRLPISGFRIYKGRKPIYGFDAVIAAFIPPKELEVINIFEWRNVKIFGVQLQSQYDEFGRYNPGKALVDESGSSVTWSNILGATRELKMDGFRFIKPLLATSGANGTRNLEPDFKQFPNITIYDQLKNAAKSQLEIEKFKHKEFIVDTSGDDVFDIDFGDLFYLVNDNIVSDSDKPATDNSIQIVAKRIEYSLTKPPGGLGGLRRRIMGSKIFT